MPEYIISSETGKALPVTSMNSTFRLNKDIKIAPQIPETVTNLDYTFWECTNLKEVTIPNTVVNIGTYAFSSCSSLTSINIPNSVTSIGEWAFSECTSLSNIIIPDSVTSIGYSAFGYWTSSQTINCQATEKPSGWDEDWNIYNYNTPCKATVNWGVSM